ncbi:ExeM/NucH family extracellular endonuclease [Paraglaciecola arctica]|uniref:ExeM/NucH family extracellular endonuclease n=1 Tax=Paraglaciecola arctica TaxID=1128911 RepID=UPI001C07023B|nr:ExeM/NucH family extracellular endonuclease [Paraglaciecola arctica]MBU3004380.1 ExeM/NucH family extracellular endonuclease [Paraglaciecola arctica]
MKLKFPALLALVAASSVQASDIVITGVYDGPLSGGTPKGVELFVKNDIADLSVCGIGSANNGGGSDGEEFTFPAITATAGSYIYIASESSQFTAFFGFTPNYTAGFASINGDDAIELFCDGAVVDVFGDINTDGTGTAWDSLDGWAYRNADTGPDGSIFSIANWSFSGVNGLEGGTTNDTVTSPFPLKTYAEEIAGGDDGGSGGGEEPTEPCFNCPELAKIADASTFDDATYYANAIVEVDAGSSAEIIKNAINSIISSDHRDLSYSEVWTALTHTDEDPANSDNVILWYKGTSIAKNLNGSGSQSSDQDNWNREHSWPQSHGFADMQESAEAYTDIHHLRPTDISVNASRGNLDFDNSDNELTESSNNKIDSDSFEPRDEVKGDVARMMFYMDTRYEGSGSDATPDLQLVDSLTSTGTTELGRLCRLIEWHNADPVNAAEQLRNNTIYEYQGNRNPFIDHPEWVDILYQTAACSDSGAEPEPDPEPTPENLSTDIIISGVIDGPLSGGIPKAIELYVVNDIDDLSQCGIGSANNGGGSDGQEFTFDAVSASAGDFIYVASEIPGFNAFFGFDPDYTSGAAGINGDDAIELFCADEVVDTFGDINVDGSGEAWDYLDGWAYRIANTGPDGTTFVLDNWTFSGINTLDGVSDNASADPAFPLGTFFVDEKLIISGVVDASLPGGLPKAIEFYAATDIEDLSVFGFGSANNGGGSDGQEYTFSGSAKKGDYIYIASETPNFEVFFGFAPTDTSGAAGINGDDAIELFRDGVVVDVFGDINTDGSGEAWEYLDGWAYRKSNTGPDGSTFVLENWTFSGINVLDGQATHDSSTTPFPLSSFIGNGSDAGGDIPGECCEEVTFIHQVQGAGDTSPLTGETVLVEGIVSASFTDIGGFFVQEEDADMDADPSTSEGIFVSYSGELPVVGALVSVKGEVSESFARTQLTATVAPEIISTDTAGATAFTLTLPFADSSQAESLEGMLVSASQALVVTDSYYLGRFGEVTLSSQRLFNPTNVFAPGSIEATELEVANALDRILLDDGSSEQNPELVVYPTGGLSANNTLRLGDTVASLTGILDYSYSEYRVIPTQDPTFVATNPRTAEPDLNLGNLTVASLNVLNFFNTLDLDVDICGPAGDAECRGADSSFEYERQLAKTVAAIVAMDADIVGLMEIENDGFTEDSAIVELVNNVNAIMGEATYAIVETGGTIGTDAITVALIYKPSVVVQSAAPTILDSSNSISDNDGVLFLDTKNRPSLVQKFALVENGEELVVSVNHLKSKGSSCGAGDDDTTTGQGNCNLTRTRAAQALTAFITEQFGDTPALIIGDLNAYAKEDPITAILDAGYTDLANAFVGDEAYSYSFDGLLGYLDHALASDTLLPKVIDAVEWHINADEPIVLDYNVEYKKDSHLDSYFSDDAYRMSDHDPVVISILLESEVEVVAGDVNGDGNLDMNDYYAFIGAYGSSEGDAAYNAAADMNSNGIIDMTDFQLWYQVYLAQ